MQTFKIVVDTREQAAYTFASIKPRPEVIYKALASGDYSLEGYEDRITIERKSLPDLFGSTGIGRKRFEREFERLAKFEYAGLVIEAGLGDIFKRPPAYSQMNPKSVFHTLISWSVYYKVFVWAAPDRAFGEKLTYYLLKKWWTKNVEQI
uniref:Putative nuclease n=1 Tax=viral metagenome TaxID=1070528 RepID=A0A6M3IY62_9ZZZZ